MGVPQKGWFLMEHPTKTDDNWGYPHDSGNLHMISGDDGENMLVPIEYAKPVELNCWMPSICIRRIPVSANSLQLQNLR